MEDVKEAASVETTETDTETSTPTDASSDTKEEPSVPYSRFKEVNSKYQELRGEIDALKQTKKDGGLTPEQQKELDAKSYLKNLLRETLEEDRMTKATQEKLEQDKFESEVDDMLIANPSIARKDFIEFLEKDADKFGVTTVTGAMNLFKELQGVSKEASEKTKRDIQAKPGLPKAQAPGAASNYAELDKGKSLRQVVDEITNSLDK